jgi:DNA-binding LacI/PurR family transcriptional regulator/signal transduction histidine kinase
VCFVGHRIGSPVASEAAANIAYGIADTRTIDGLIVITSAIATFLGPTETARLFAARPGIPHVSVGLGVPGVPGVKADGSEGVSFIVRHLIRDHGLRRFALIAGPQGHSEAQERERAFRSALAGEGVTFDEGLAAGGTFLRDSGADAARRLMETGLPFDAIVCMNDRMALGAMDVLRGAGIRVPQDVAVVGFDGIEEGRYTTPPLTTVTQPLRELGSTAVDLAVELLAGGEPRDRVLTCTPAIRQSCGCPPRRRYDAGLDALPVTATPAERAAVDDLAASAGRNDGDAFIARLTSALDETTIGGGEPGRWNNYLSVAAAHAEPPAPDAAEARTARAALFEFARVLVGEAESRLQAARRIAAEERLATLRAISASLAGAFEMPVMLARLEAGLARLGISGGYIALFDDQTPEAEWSRLVMGPRAPEERPLPARGIRFRTRQLLPSRVDVSWRRLTWVLEPLVFQNEPLGFILLPGIAEEPAVYGTLREQVASALKGALLLDQVLTHERRLQTEVARRTGELTRANAELTREVERRMRLEREVSEISNRTMQRIGQDLHDDLCQHLAGIAMLASALRGTLTDNGSAAVASVEHIGALLADSITRAKQIARGLHPAGLEENGLVAAVEELVEAARRNYPAVIEFRAAPDFRLPGTDRALQVYRIVQEALTNALRHSHSGRIEVKLSREEQPNPPAGRGRRPEERRPVLVAEVTDFGEGLPLSIDGDGMGLRIMRYRAETAGAELRVERLKPGTRVSCRLDCSQGEP